MCGIFGSSNLSWQCFSDGFSSLQHRGQDAAGWLSFSDGKTQIFRQEGAILDALQEGIPHSQTASQLFIGHNRYATTGPKTPENIQPFHGTHSEYSLGLIHNGNLRPDCVSKLKSQLTLKPLPILGSSDTSVLTNLLLQKRLSCSDWTETLQQVLPPLQGAFALLLITDEGTLYGVRDKWGIRPLVLGKDTRGGWCLASETVALTAAGCTFVREVKPGEVVHIHPDGKMSSFLYTSSTTDATLGTEGTHSNFCLLEIIYFSNARSLYKKRALSQTRYRLGQTAAKIFLAKHITIDKVVPILNGGKYFAQGAASVLGKPLEEAIVKNGNKRSFIANTIADREKIIHDKLLPLPKKLSGQKILLVDDSIVRGTSLRILLARVRQSVMEKKPAVLPEIHLLVGSPPVVGTCDLGVDLADENDVLASRWKERPLAQTEEEMAHFFGVASITFTPVKRVMTTLGVKNNQLCYHCFGGEHPLQ